MKFLSIKKIKSKSLLIQFMKKYHENSGNDVSIDFLERASVVRGIYSKQENLIGGYVLNANRPHRYISDIPIDAALHNSIPTESDMVEGCCIWMKKEINSFQRGWVYLTIYYDYISLGKRYMLGASTEPKVVKLQRLIFPNVLYEGPIGHAPWCCMYFGTKRHMAKLLLIILSKYWVGSLIKIGKRPTRNV